MDKAIENSFGDPPRDDSNLRALRRRLIVAGLTRPEANYYWLQAVIRLSENRYHRRDARAFRNFALDAGDVCERLGFRSGLDRSELAEVGETYRVLEQSVYRLYGPRDSGRPPSVVSLQDAEAIYSLVRLLAPSEVVETGVSDGMSTYFILLAMNRNGRGFLSSIDLPTVGLPRVYGKPPGWLVPENLRDRWNLRIGSSEKLLTPLLWERGEIDAFFHDSEHSYHRMRWEFSLAKQHLRPEGLIISDDSLANDAFLSMAKSGQGMLWTVTRDGLGVLRTGRSAGYSVETSASVG